jgi:hypothetical protein
LSSSFYTRLGTHSRLTSLCFKRNIWHVHVIRSMTVRRNFIVTLTPHMERDLRTGYSIGEFTIGATTVLMTVAKIPATIPTLQGLMKWDPSVVRLGLLQVFSTLRSLKYMPTYAGPLEHNAVHSFMLTFYFYKSNTPVFYIFWYFIYPLLKNFTNGIRIRVMIYYIMKSLGLSFYKKINDKSFEESISLLLTTCLTWHGQRFNLINCKSTSHTSIVLHALTSNSAWMATVWVIKGSPSEQN